jgi:cell wall-associated NlpC family hydrolase
MIKKIIQKISANKQVWAGDAIVAWARYSNLHKDQWIYTQGPTRFVDLRTPFASPITADCSSAVTYWFYWAGITMDPNGLGYNGYGYTGTLLSHGTKIDKSSVAPGDVVVYGEGTGDHTALVVEVHGPDILTISHGDSKGPRYVWVSKPTTVPSKRLGVDGRTPVTYLRFNKMASRPVFPPA